MRKNLILGTAIFAAVIFAGALAYAASQTTGTVSVCATATLPANTINGNGGNIGTIPGTSTVQCATTTYTVPTNTVTTTVSGSGSSSSTTTSSTTTASLGSCGVNPPGASWTVGGHDYTRAGWDTFTKNQASGASWSNGNDTTPVYTGDRGMPWVTYPDGWGANGVTPAYQPSTVLSVHDGVLDFNLHNELGSSPSPIPTGGQNQTYGAYSFCEKVAPDAGSNLRDFKQAVLLWPQSDANGPAAESDFPEGNFTDPSGAPSTSMSAFAHHNSTQDAYPSASLDLSQWHVYTQTWGPGFRSYYVDGTLIGTSTTSVWSQPERWQLQVQPLAGSTTGGHGHVYVNWVWIGSPVGSSSSSSSTTSTTTSTTPTTSTTSTTPTTSTTTTSTTTSGPPPGQIQHVVEIWMENQDYGNVYPSQPFEKTFADQGGLATNYYATGHFSLDNYLTATSGLIGVGNNDSCLSSSANNIFNQLGSGSAVNYEESGNACRHEPASQYSDLGSSYQAPLPSAFTATTFNPKFVFISPSTQDDGHDTSASFGDNWLSGIVPRIEGTPQYQNGSMALFIVYDESNVNDTQGNTTPPDNHVYVAVQHQGMTAVKDSTQFTHCSLLRTVEDVFNLPALGCAASATSMVGHFGL